MIPWVLFLALVQPTQVPSPLPSGPDSGEVHAEFARNREALSKPGVHTSGGLVFCCVCSESKALDAPDLRDQAQEEAIAELAIGPIVQAVRATDWGATTMGAEFIEVAARTRPGTVRLEGVTTVQIEDVPGKACAIVAMRATPPARIEELTPAVVADLRSRLATGKAHAAEALLLLEMDPPARERPLLDAVLDAIDRECGDGFGASVEGRWIRRDGTPLQSGLRDWCARAAMRDSKGLEQLVWVDWADMTPRERLHALGCRAGDAELAALVHDDLRKAGWIRGAELLRTAANRAQRSIPAPSTDSRVSPNARTRLLLSPVVMVMLLSEGAQPALLPAVAPGDPDFEAARKAFNLATPEGLNEAVERLAGLLSDPSHASVEAASLLSAAMLTLGEPELAARIATAAFRNGPDHRYTGVNLMLARRALGQRDEVRRLLPEVEAKAKLDDWGRQQIAELRTWVGS